MFFDGVVMVAEETVEPRRNELRDRLEVFAIGGLVRSGENLLVDDLALALPLCELLIFTLPH